MVALPVGSVVSLEEDRERLKREHGEGDP